MNFKFFTKGEWLGSENGGFSIRFQNGATISVQSSPRHYATEGFSAEVHAWGPNGERINLKGRQDVVGWVQPDDLAKLMGKVSRWKPKE